MPPKREDILASINTKPTQPRPPIKKGPELTLSTQPKKADDGQTRSALGHAVRDDLKRALKQVAAAQGRYTYEVTEEALLEYLKNHGLERYLEK
jgi:hypothetical protein